MTQQISMEDAFPTFEKKTVELFRANMLLQAQLDVRDRELAAAREEISRLKGEPAPEPPAGPNLATQPPYPGDDHN